MVYYKKILFLLTIVLVLAPITFIRAVPDRDPTYGAADVAKRAQLPDTVAGATNLPAIIGAVIGMGLSLVGIVFFILILYSGFRWMTAMGRTEIIDSAKGTMEEAIIGLVIVIAAYAITNFVFENLLAR